LVQVICLLVSSFFPQSLLQNQRDMGLVLVSFDLLKSFLKQSDSFRLEMMLMSDEDVSVFEVKFPSLLCDLKRSLESSYCEVRLLVCIDVSYFLKQVVILNK